MRVKNTSKVIYEGKCPKCRQWDIFKYPLSNLRHFASMNEHCPECGLRFEVEPGFFIGAMYISYGFCVTILIATGVILSYAGVTDTITYVLTTFGVTLLLPVIFRYSRILFLHWFGGVKFKEQANY